MVVLTLLPCPATALPEIPEGVSPEAFYDGFFPTEEWIAQLRAVPREQRRSPFQNIQVVDKLPSDPKVRWPGAVVRLTTDDIKEMEADMQRFLAVAPEAYAGLVPRRNRISGNARVMLTTRVVPCPRGDDGKLSWHPDAPETIECSTGHTVDPFSVLPQTGSFRVQGPLGEEQEYPYHDTPDGKKRVYLLGEFMHPLRVATLARGALHLGMLYSLTQDECYALRSAAILHDFALAVPHWPKVSRGYYSGFEGQDRLRPVTDYCTYSGIWYDKYHSGIAGIPLRLAQAYDLVVSAPVWQALNASSPNGDARAHIEEDLFLYTVRDAIRYDIHHPQTASALSNYIPYQISGLITIGRAIGVPELVHYAYWKEQQLARKTLMADGMFPESPSYARQHVYGMARAARLAEDYTDPPGFTSTIDGVRFDTLDMLRDLPELRRALEVLETLAYPDGSNIMVHDTYGRPVSRGFPAPAETRPLLYPAFGHAVLARGERDRANQVQAHLHYSGNWGHDHLDMLNLILWAYEDELVSDIGYAHTYRFFANNTSGHNLVVVDRRYQERVVNAPGDLIAWHPVPGAPQIAEVSAPHAYPQCSVYRRALFLLPVGSADNLVLDIFEVKGGHTHEWMAQGSCTVDGTLEVSVPCKRVAASYADDGKPFCPPQHNEYVRQRRQSGQHPWWDPATERDPWYGVFREVREGAMAEPAVARFSYAPDHCPDLRVHILRPERADIYTCTVPSLRRTWSEAEKTEKHEFVEKYRMPKLIVRRDGDELHSRFVALWEPLRKGSRTVTAARDLAPDSDGWTALEVITTTPAGQETIRLYHSSDPTARLRAVDGTELQGRYAVVMQAAEHERIYLYDCTWFKRADCVITVEDCPALALKALHTDAADDNTLVLTGRWPEWVARRPSLLDTSDHIILHQGGQRVRAFPFTTVAVVEDETRIRCPRHPGFTYDNSTHTLREVFSPFNTVTGQAVAHLASRVCLRLDVRQPQTWRVRTTNPISIAGRNVAPCESETVVTP